ncbi:neurturin [Corythoichthys intestinalis]|uniref:neurturin n=1 Tax=Corythoichthys intestinalis TaxID=161448 RepID=UPI0025A662FD|nr:neurturin [Corythoichthys intestinalis]XP_057714352.1 neurturin [Corythoichthys intestinalis]XP_057714353.1 neurturin [Corythoichthys intestinalis]
MTRRHGRTSLRASSGGTRWRNRRKERLETTSVMSAKVLLWVLLFLLPLADGAHIEDGDSAAGLDLGHAAPLLEGQEEQQVVTLSEEQEDYMYSPWHHLYDPFVTDEADDDPSSRLIVRAPRSLDASELQPKKKKRKKTGKDETSEKGERKSRSKNKQSKQSSKDCHVEKREMKVRDLGLGFDSDEIILFKFCVGSCQSSRTNYDLALKTLLKNGSLPRRTARKVSTHPCCRPERYEPVSFMDAQTTWRTITSLSAASCICMG